MHALIMLTITLLGVDNPSLSNQDRYLFLAAPTPASSEHIRVSNSEMKTGYLSWMHVHDGIFVGNSFVTCINNKAYIRIINTLDYEVKILIPIVRLMKVVGISRGPTWSPSPSIYFNANMFSVSSNINEGINSPHKLQSNPSLIFRLPRSNQRLLDEYI